jgi:primosomal protein N' (replication factor Y) (superfamily II helicase)
VQVEPMTTARALRGPFDYRLPQESYAEVGVGSMLVVPFGQREILGVVTAISDSSEVSEEKLLAPVRALDQGAPTLPLDLVALATWLADEYCSTLARAFALVLPPAAARRLSGRKPRATSVPTHVQVGARMPRPPALTVEQDVALAELRQALAASEPQTRLLAGITGSGKTEIYLRIASDTLAGGQGAIVLVPEIALTPQIVGRFIERFGDTVAVLHSGLTIGQRREQWRRLRFGEARVCVGPRSAIFAPIERLGLIVVDEEHDSSYKHEGDPRYDARTVAAQRASDSRALLVLGSATPRPESAHAASLGSSEVVCGEGRGLAAARPRGLALLRLNKRVDGRPLPRVRVLDMREQDSGLHPLTSQTLAEVRSARGKAIVLLNRRGWSNFLTCRSCGRVWGCPQCDVALVLHRSGRADYIACHHCGHRQQAPRRCECGSTSVARHGTGTERLQHDLGVTLDDGDFPIFRLDADTVARDGSENGVARLLARFQDAPAGVLIGTQMVAKGHDFPDVGLGVVLDADATLRFPDFRAEERTFALVCQLAGRVGRGESCPPAQVLVQTMAPHARSIQHAAAHDSDGFLSGELQRRRALEYPPFATLIRVVCAAQTTSRAHAAAAAIRSALEQTPGNVLGPAALFRLRGRERQVLVVKTPPQLRQTTIAVLGAAVQRVAKARAHKDVAIAVDVDPQ